MTVISQLDSIPDAVDAIRNGDMVVVVDDEARENEGDLVAAASAITLEQMAFMIRHTSGIVCAPIAQEEARRLKLDPMVAFNDAPLGTAFTVSVDYKKGLTTGISAHERVATVKALANANIQAHDFVRPGHIFPLIAKSGGVLMRSGHTEAAVDLMSLAQLPKVGVICELVNDDGSVKRLPQLLLFAREHGLKIISVSDLIAYRQSREKLVKRVDEFELMSPIGLVRGLAYTSIFDEVQHIALVAGDIGADKIVTVRLHRENILEDVFGNRDVLLQSYEIFEKQGGGVLVYLREGTTGVPGWKSGVHEEGHQGIWRDVGVGAQILRDLEIKSVRLVTSSRHTYVGLSGFDIEIAEIIKLKSPRARMGFCSNKIPS